MGMQAELEEEKAEADKESKELDEEKKKSEAELGKEMGDDAAAMGELAKKIKNETAAEQEELTELNEVKTGMDKLAKEDAKVNEERTEEGIQDKKVLAKQAAQKAKMEKDMGAAKAKFAQKEKKEEGNVNKEKDLSERERVVIVGEE